MACSSYSFVCTISLSSLCKLIWRHWTYKIPLRYILSSVWVRLRIFSPLSIIQYVGLYVLSLPISPVMIERIYILFLIIIIKSEVWTITHCLGLGHETMVPTVCLSIFLCMHQCMEREFYLKSYTGKSHSNMKITQRPYMTEGLTGKYVINGTDWQLVCYSTFCSQYIAFVYYPYKTPSFSSLYILHKHLIAAASFSMWHIV